MTLTEVNYNVKRFAPLVIILLLVLLVFFFAFQLFFLYLESSSTSANPNAAAPLTVNPIFEKIKRPILPNTKSSDSVKYVLDTLDGTTNTEVATSAAHVYFLPQPPSRFGFLSRIITMAQKFDIDTDITQHTLDDKIATFDDGKRKLAIDINTFNFSFEYRITDDDTIWDNTRAPSETAIETSARALLSSLEKYPAELAQGTTNILYFNYNPATKELTKVDTIAEANMAEVDFFSADLDGKPVVTSTYFNSPNFVLYALNNGNLQVLRAKSSIYEKSKDQIGVYPVITSDQAWKDLQAGKGSIISQDDNTQDIKIKKIYLAYFEPEVYQEYMQPMYVFLGEGNFVAYVTAVTEEYLLPQE
ncbi:MAG: hypothetical protein ACEQSA_03410 [Weeksellaceae bacterium]